MTNNIDDRRIFISLEDAINNVADRQHFSKEQKEKMYREWSNIADTWEVVFDDKNRIIGCAPDRPCEKINLTIKIDPKTGEVDYV